MEFRAANFAVQSSSVKAKFTWKKWVLTISSLKILKTQNKPRDLLLGVKTWRQGGNNPRDKLGNSIWRFFRRESLQIRRTWNPSRTYFSRCFRVWSPNRSLIWPSWSAQLAEDISNWELQFSEFSECKLIKLLILELLLLRTFFKLPQF